MRSTLVRAVAAAWIAALGGCVAQAPSAAPLSGRVTLSCMVEFAIVTDGAAQVVDQSTRVIWLDLDNARYAISELGDTAIDQEWAQALSRVRAEHDGLAPAAGRSGAFMCMVRGEDRQCVHGVDLQRRLYAFATPAAQEGEAVTAMMHGRGRCAPAPDVAWPAAEEGGR